MATSRVRCSYRYAAVVQMGHCRHPLVLLSSLLSLSVTLLFLPFLQVVVMLQRTRRSA